MFDLPIHPVVVHFPIALGVLLPLIALLAIWASGKVGSPSRVWAIVPLVALLYFSAAIVAVETGEDDEKTVGAVVAHEFIEEHEELGEKIPWVAGAILLMTVLPLGFQRKTELQWAAVVFSVLGVVPLALVGHSGGSLIYKYGAAQAFINTPPKALEEGDTASEAMVPEPAFEEDPAVVPVNVPNDKLEETSPTPEGVDEVPVEVPPVLPESKPPSPEKSDQK